jgi:cyclophilin family peptidyl-prolyl cis-trans isomerase
MFVRFRSRAVFSFVLVLSFAVIVAACGGDDDTANDDAISDDEVAEQVTSDDADSDLESAPAESTDVDDQAEAETEQEENQEQEEGEEDALQQPSMQWNQPPEMQLAEGADYQAVVTTNRGEVVINLLQDDAPLTVNNFVFLAEQGFYSDVPFHRVISGFMIQTGDPTGTGAGGPGYRFEDEQVTRDYTPGTVAMANAGPNTNGSQFFIVHGDLRGQLPPNYTIFGEVTEGMDVVDAIANVPVQRSRSGEMSSPTEEVKIESVEIRS